MIKLKNFLKEQNLTDLENIGYGSSTGAAGARDPRTGNFVASSVGRLNETEKKIYQHVLNAVAELTGMTADDVDDITEQSEKRQMYNRQIDPIIKAISKLADDIENDGY